MNIEDKLKAKLYRAACPEATELGEYQLRLLPASRMQAMEQHLQTCPHCRQELAHLRQYLADLSPEIEYSLVERVNVWIARLLPDAADSMAPQPAFALRGNARGPLMYEAGDAQLTLEVQVDPEHADRRSILGLMVGVEPADVQARLWQKGEPIATTAVDDLGNFAFADLEPGQYELILSGPDFEIHVQTLSV